MIVKLLTEQHLEFLSLKGGCRGSSESSLVKMPHCWKCHATAHILFRLDKIHNINMYMYKLKDKNEIWNLKLISSDHVNLKPLYSATEMRRSEEVLFWLMRGREDPNTTIGGQFKWNFAGVHIMAQH